MVTVPAVAHEIQVPSGVAVLPARTFMVMVVLAVVLAAHVIFPKLIETP